MQKSATINDVYQRLREYRESKEAEKLAEERRFKEQVSFLLFIYLVSGCL